MELKGVREAIDAIDSDIVALLRRRFELAVRAGKLKKFIEDPLRDKQVLENVKRIAGGLVAPEFMESLYASVMNEAKRQQQANYKLIAFQGEHGAYGEMAAMEFDKGGVPIPCDEFADVFECVKNGSVNQGILPIENSIGGDVTEVEDLLIESGLSVVGEVNLPVHHCLLALPDIDYRDVRIVYSHPQALSQCKEFLVRNKLEGRPYYNTAGAARMLARERPIGAAVLASRLCAELYGLEILKENVENFPNNITRFLVLAREPLRAQANKCSILFVTPHKPGALFNFLRAFSKADINLTRIESRPARGAAGHVAFLLDFQGSSEDQNVQTVFNEIKKECQDFKLLGCYREWGDGGSFVKEN